MGRINEINEYSYGYSRQVSHVPGRDKYRAWGDVFRSSRSIVPYKSNPSPILQISPNIALLDQSLRGPIAVLFCEIWWSASLHFMHDLGSWEWAQTGAWHVWRSGWIPITVLVLWGRMCSRSRLTYYCIINIFIWPLCFCGLCGLWLCG
jgi:hypothetical protein